MPDDCCGECIYCNEESYCLRKKDAVLKESFCLHYVPSSKSHSLDILVDEMASLFRNMPKGAD